VRALLRRRRALPGFAARRSRSRIAHIEAVTAKRFGNAADPLLVSVRSGARVSMPA
jgi:pyruvate,orthophosphate dikinase